MFYVFIGAFRFKFLRFSSRFLMMFILLEILRAVSLFIFVYLISMGEISVFLFLLMLTLIVGEAVIGLRVIISSSRRFDRNFRLVQFY